MDEVNDRIKQEIKKTAKWLFNFFAEKKCLFLNI